jgi:CAAX protease family protein
MTTITATPTDAAPTRPQARLGGVELTVAVVGFLALSLFSAVLVQAFVGNPSVPVVLLATELSFGGAVAIALAVRVRSLVPLKLANPGVRWPLAGIGAAVGLFLLTRVVIIVWVLVTGPFANPQADLTSTAALGGWSLVAMLATGALLTPLAEELFFRGICYGALRRFGPAVATIGSAALFGLAHGSRSCWSPRSSSVW